MAVPFRGRSQQEGLEEAEAAKREKRRKLEATQITGDVNADRVNQLRSLTVKVPGSGTGAELEGAKEVWEIDREETRYHGTKWCFVFLLGKQVLEKR